MASATPGGMDSVKPRLRAGTRLAANQRLAEDLLEGEPLATAHEEPFARADLAQEIGVAETRRGRLEPLVLVDVDDHGGGPPVARHDHFLLAVVDAGHELRQSCPHPGGRPGS